MPSKCQRFCLAFGFTILTLVTVGTTVVLFSFAVHYSKKLEVSKGLTNGVIIALVVSIVVFLFAIIASFAAKRCLRGTLGIIYIVYAIFVLGMAIVLLAFKSKILTLIGDAFKNENKDITKSIKEGFNCLYWMNISLINDPNNCYDKVSDFWNKKGKVVAYILIAVFVILVAGIVLSFVYACCCKNKEDDLSSNSNSQFNTPLTYGW